MVTVSLRCGVSDAAIGGHVDISLGHQQRAVAHLGDGHDELRFGETDARRHARDAAPWDEIETGDVDQRICGAKTLMRFT